MKNEGALEFLRGAFFLKRSIAREAF